MSRTAPLPAAPSVWRMPGVTPMADRWGPRLLIAVCLTILLLPAAGVPGVLGAMAAIGFGLMILGIWQPVVGILGVAILCTIDPLMNRFVFTGGLLRWNTFNYLLALVTAVFGMRLLAHRAFPLRVFVGFLVLLLLQLMLSRAVGDGVQTALEASAFLGLLVYSLRAGGEAATWQWMGLLMGFVGAVASSLYFPVQAGLPPMSHNASVYVPLAGLVGVCLTAPPVVPRRWESARFVFAGLNFLWIFLSGSRSGLLSGTVCLLFLLSTTRGLGRKLTIALVTCILTVTAASVFGNLQQEAIARVEILLDPNTSVTDRTSGRSALIEGGLEIFLEHPLGIGTGGFPLAWRELGATRTGGWGRATEKDAHSAWIMTLVENGIPGILLLVAFAGSFALWGWKLRRIGLLPLGLLISVLFGLGFFATEFQNKLLWFSGAVGVALLTHRRVGAGDRNVGAP